VLTFSGNRDCICIPAYSAQGYKVNQTIEVLQQQYAAAHRVHITLDNAAHVQFSSGHTPKRAHWLVAGFRRLPQSFVLSSELIGRMDVAGMKKLCECLLELSELANSPIS